uniref:Uncharacterized protein n=1 Tax=Anopheles atroparvus TaxID=41427 RepID=A0AAG5DL13_ANOAO
MESKCLPTFLHIAAMNENGIFHMWCCGFRCNSFAFTQRWHYVCFVQVTVLSDKRSLTVQRPGRKKKKVSSMCWCATSAAAKNRSFARFVFPCNQNTAQIVGCITVTEKLIVMGVLKMHSRQQTYEMCWNGMMSHATRRHLCVVYVASAGARWSGLLHHRK